MKVVNDGMPGPLYRAVSEQREPDYTSPKTISVTELIGPARIRMLRLAKWDEIEEKASDRIWLADGTALHAMLEKYADPDTELAEHRISAEIDGWTVHGTFDLYSITSETLYDYKKSGVMGFSRGVKLEYKQQLNCYAFLLGLSGRTVRTLKVVAVYRDWMKSKRMTQGYPQKAYEEFEVEKWSHPQALAFIRTRLAAHEPGHGMNDVLPLCTPEERWQRDTQYAVVKRGAKRATRVLDSKADAEAHARSLVQVPNLWQKMYEIQHRPGADVRCDDYCMVRKFCTQAELRAKGVHT